MYRYVVAAPPGARGGGDDQPASIGQMLQQMQQPVYYLRPQTFDNNGRATRPRGRAEDYTPDLTRMSIHWKTLLGVHWTTPVKVHWTSDNPLDKYSIQVKLRGRVVADHNSNNATDA